LTTRGLDEAAFRKVGDFLHEAAQIAIKLNETAKTPKDFEAAVKDNADVKSLKLKVMQFITQYPMPGFDTTTMKYKHVTV
jgi:glycine hydroxymethyltransferase